MPPHSSSAMMKKSRLIVFCCFSLVLLCLSVGSEDSADVKGIQLMRHSLESARVLDASDWEIGGSANPLGDRVLLSSMTTQRAGHLWSKSPILTNSFELEFSFQILNAPPIDNQAQVSNQAEGFACWLSPHPFSGRGDAGSTGAPDLFGGPNKFTGLGVFFKLHDRTNKFNPSISAVYSDGQREWNVVTDVPTNFGVYWQILGGREPMNFKLTVQPSVVVGEAKVAGSMKWTETFRLNASIPIGGYLGFTADGGTAEPDTTLPSRGVTLWDIRTYNRNLNSIEQELGSDVREVVSTLGKITEGNVTEALQVISTTMTKLVSEILPRQNEIARALQLIEMRLENLSDDLEGIQHHIGAPHAHHEAIEKISGQVTKLKQLFDDHSHSQARATERLIQVGRTMHEKGESVHDRNLETLQTHLSKQAKMNWFMFALLMGVILLVVGFVWRKTKQMEKNHMF